MQENNNFHTHTHTKNNEEPNKLIHDLKIVQHLSGGYGQVDLDRCMHFGLATHNFLNM